MKELADIVEKCKQIIITPETISCIQALYIGGSIKPKDRTPNSDIDIIGIVENSFPEDLEADINKLLKKSIEEMKCKLRVLYLSELKGGKQRGFISTLLPIRLFIRRIPSFPLIWGIPLNINETIGAYTLKEEIKVQSLLIKKYIKNIHSNDKKIPFEWIPKAVLYLSALELVLVRGIEYSTSFFEIQYCWNDDRYHIAHDSMDIRGKGYDISLHDKSVYIAKAESYLEKMNVLYLN
ncbi:MAG: hypothetical protein HQ557_18530 [Bacteroidetes bacterium]|nr:hypothetical protein [Bacteroidota bacterium]